MTTWDAIQKSIDAGGEPVEATLTGSELDEIEQLADDVSESPSGRFSLFSGVTPDGDNWCVKVPR